MFWLTCAKSYHLDLCPLEFWRLSDCVVLLVTEFLGP